MPNHFWNDLSISGDAEKVKELQAFVKGRGPRYADLDPYDYGMGARTGVPIEAALEDPDSDVSELDFHKIIPVPMEILKKGYGDSGYDWQVDNWDTKWNAYDLSTDSSEGYCRFSFDTAWAPPVLVVAQLAKLFPSLEFEHFFDESGMGFQGTNRYLEGALIEETYLEGDDYPSDDDDEEEESLGINKLGEFPRAK